MNSQESSYRQIVKTTSFFGGIQVFQIIIGIIRSKFIAVLLGPAGMGVSGLLTTTIGFIGGLTGFGLSTSAVKDIASAHGSGNEIRVSIVASVFRRLVWITGSLGSVVTLVLSPWLSRITFGNSDYTYAFMLISVTLLINQVSAGQGVLLRGMRKIKYMSQSAVIGSILGLFTTVPLYYFFGMKGIVPGIIVTSVTSLLLTWYFVRKLSIKPVYVSKIRTIAEGKGMLTMGFMISLSGLITLGASYIVRIFISRTGGIDQVGLYNAGFAIVNTYVGMIFSAMSTDYYPRLSAVASSNEESRKAINQQAEIALLILAPVIMVFLVFINLVIILLYSSKFVPVKDMIIYAALGMFFKAASWPIGFIFLAKGASKIFFCSEVIANIYILLLNIIGYKYFGLTGLGFSFLISYIILLIQVYLIANFKYEFNFIPAFYRIFGMQFSIALVCLLIVKVLGNPYSYLAGSVIIVLSSLHALRELDRRINLRSVMVSIRNRIRL